MSNWLYLIIPGALALIALIGLVVMVVRKWTYLRKLSPDAHVMGGSLLHDYAPEVVDWVRTRDWAEYKRVTMVEFEKVLRRLRLVVGSVDRVSDRLIRSVRRSHEQVAVQQERAAMREAAAELPQEEEITDPVEVLKQREQDLIVAISQSPKDVELYRQLARAYIGLKQWRDAKEALEAALKLAPDDESLVKRLESVNRRLEQESTG